ncbi:hypothetical protein BDV30DRAFT_3881 [Aspergillus minisclerotigenes]|uniref:Uncharacterized protein n=1 Tax=Aspergillus minisclerotigenes TaxID=656917 RepID=A0A5N6JPA3_9EURO|nr:hypothetical protein BDV30DRAFT_3881 [Aspergillus minisclerotigenes]
MPHYSTSRQYSIALPAPRVEIKLFERLSKPKEYSVFHRTTLAYSLCYSPITYSLTLLALSLASDPQSLPKMH